jgi:Undecaprenyl-phosphate glucose phosphotransferase
MKEHNLLAIYVFVDLFLLNLSLFGVSFFYSDFVRSEEHYTLQFYMLQANLAWIATYFAFVKNNLYLRDSFRRRVYRICRRVIIFSATLMVLTFAFMREPVARMYMLSYVSVFWGLELVAYRLIYLYASYARSIDRYSTRALLIGYNETSCLFRKLIESTPMLGYKFVGYVTQDALDVQDIPEEERAYVLGNTSQLEEILQQNRIHVVFSVFSYFLDKADIDRQLSVCNHYGCRMYLFAETQRWLRQSQDAEEIGDFYVLNPQRIPLDEVTNRILKRTFDIFFSLAVMLLFGWNLFLLIVLLIKVTSRGPVFFTQKRTGLNNLSFRCYKFRSMYTNGSSDDRQATRGDARITPFGRFMRRWNIDELPQFFNVLCGQMSVVGPRPHMLKHTEQYSALIQYYKVRHYVKPGITGWAQVNGWRGETDATWKMEKRVKYDMDYIENWTFLWDMKIIWLTVFGKNAWKNAR